VDRLAFISHYNIDEETIVRERLELLCRVRVFRAGTQVAKGGRL
jgi:hypothetical protein